MSRRAKGTIPALVFDYLTGPMTDRGVSYTPYFVAKALNLSPGSVTAACKALVREGKVKCVGESPYMVARR